MFTTKGERVKHVGAGVLANHHSLNAVSFAEGGEFVVADCSHHRICVFSADGKLINAWGTQGSTAGMFVQPTSLVVTCTRIYVLDLTRVQVFE